MKGIIAGVIVGIIGAAAWAAVAFFTGFEIGWIAWGIGAGVGAAIAWGCDTSKATGVIAVVIALAAIMAGKYLAVEISLAKEKDNANQEIAASMNDEEYLISWLADGLIYDMQQNGQTINWPAGVNPDEACKKDHYPHVVWAASEATWNNMNDAEKDEFRVAVKEQAASNINEYANSLKAEGFMSSFGPIDIIFFVLAIASAYKLGAGVNKEPRPVAADRSEYEHTED